MATWPMTSRDPQRCCEAIRSAILATAWLLVYISGDSTRQSVAATTTKVTTSGWILLGRQRPSSKGSSQQETHETYPIPTPKNSWTQSRTILPDKLSGLVYEYAWIWICIPHSTQPSRAFLVICSFISPFVFTARCTLVQSAVLRSHVVCLSVCDVGELWSHRLEFYENNFTISMGRSLFATLTWRVCSKGNTPKFGPKVTNPCWFERRRHSIANCGQMVTGSATVTMESL